ncbi:hypothetical protein PV325_012324 [Microctonus aethiopoides]|uniref:SURF1-like protein n=1 Tax=Microctonus aethiopoides TaxID=144406 RepID=A0AA39F838_9HYME|nr:hypothetical protein PV325_012324 [Microctonus aethiopoides]KAK0098074.1 hypothetical protein PV326_011483 [Microctonus aethiopoides]KAK0164569.1 hypothetical protein PV328_003184 [Microctonus aethiopoides]
MSIIAISTRLLRPRVNIFSIRNVKYERPELRFRKSETLVSNKNYESEDQNLNEPVGASGYVLLGIPILTFVLGTWQVERRKWKLGLIDNLKEKVTLPPKPIPDDLNELEQMEYCPVKVRGEYLYDREFTIGPKSLIKNGAGASEQGGGLVSTRGNTGYYLITPFKLENRDVTILINRGWIPSKLNKLPKEKLNHVPGIVEITGIVRLNEQRQNFMPRNDPSSGVWTYRDVDAMSHMAGTAPIFLDLVASSEAQNGPIAGQTRITLRNEHLSYIFTWYSLSIITAWMWHRLFIRKLPLL